MSRRGSVLVIAGGRRALPPRRSVEIYPEFRRMDPFGGVVAADRGLAAARDTFAGGRAQRLRVFPHAVSVPPKECYFLYVPPNPLTRVPRQRSTKSTSSKTSQGWIPDTADGGQRLPDFGVMPDPDDSIEGQTTRLYLLELWIPPNADVARFRLEVQLKVADWIVRPMELRVMEARVAGPCGWPAPPVLPAIEQGADAAALDVVREYLSGVPLRARSASP